MLERKEILEQFGAILSGLQVPYSIGQNTALGAAADPWKKLCDDLNLGGWFSKEEATSALLDRFCL